MAEMPRLGPGAISALGVVEDSLGDGTPGRLRTMISGAQMGPERVQPFVVPDRGRMAYLGVNFTLDVTTVLVSLMQLEAYCAYAPTVLARRLGQVLQGDIKKHTPIGPFREYQDPHAKQARRGAFGLDERDEPTEAAQAELRTRRAGGSAQRDQKLIQREANKAAQAAMEAMSPGRGLGLPGSHPLAKFGTVERGGRRFFGGGGPSMTAVQGMMDAALSHAREAGGVGAGQWKFKWEGRPSANLFDSIEVEAGGNDGASFLYATSHSYYAWFVEHGHGRVLIPILGVDWVDKDKTPHAVGVTSLPLRRLGHYDYLEAMITARERKFEEKKAPWYYQVGEPWLNFDAQAGPPQPAVRMFEKGFNDFMNRKQLRAPMSGAFFRGFDQAWKHGSARVGVRILSSSLEHSSASTHNRIVQKSGRVVWQSKKTGRITAKPAGAE